MLFKRAQFFPKQLFKRFLLQQLLGVIPLLILSTIVARIYVDKRIDGASTVADAIHLFDQAFLFLAAVMIATIAGISLWTGYRLVLPLGRILVKARSILKREYYQTQKEEENDAEEEAGEWSDLESTLHRISRNMQSQDRNLSREREEIEAIMSAITEAVVAVDRQSNILFYNSQFALLFGDRDLHKRDRRVSDYVRNADTLESFRNTLKSGTANTTEMRIRTKNEPIPRNFYLSVTPLKLDGDDEVYGAVGVFHDVTDLKRMDQVRIDFVANVSHELRTPLTSIKGYAQTLKHEPGNSEQSKKFLDTIERNTDRLIALVHDLLNLSSLESGQELEKEELDLEAVTDRVLMQLESLRKEKNHLIEKKILTPHLFADPKRVEQVLFNLLENACKYVPRDGKIEVQWQNIGQEIQLKVSDNGPGIPEEHHPRIFERFYRVDSARTRDQGGTGLGLAIVKHIVQRHGGKIIVQGGLGHGTTFLCTFPSTKDR